ncbi:class I SAM-dependent methyltransferase [Neisseria leonii]|uniref:Class I SAM-dependent methyltransferase n=1 Tax=Neisseria leonii TaxID=2995413 RepID=A0A9X4IA39_9NEIS|nr:class I SAM-dependent methyltransferase [Neisseria sp. 51.81]MDD9326994.1 class I SAM-dependent methyltransferase [Neisseria sp. 51.81]
MSITATAATPDLLAYLRRIGEPEHPALAAIRAANTGHRMGKMAVAPEQAALLTWLARLIRAENYLEIGVFTGYSSTAMALTLPPHGRITACDINAGFTELAQTAWQQAGVADKITLHLQPALFTLDELIAEGKSGSFDMAFIDADKPPTPHYYERCLQLVRPGGIIAIDNILLGGRVLHDAPPNAPQAWPVLQAFNAALPHDRRIIPITLPLGDGLTLLQKR